jgi:hypothetical protein
MVCQREPLSEQVLAQDQAGALPSRIGMALSLAHIGGCRSPTPWHTLPIMRATVKRAQCEIGGYAV